jgi:flagellar hook-length control protein FliK
VGHAGQPPTSQTVAAPAAEQPFVLPGAAAKAAASQAASQAAPRAEAGGPVSIADRPAEQGAVVVAPGRAPAVPRDAGVVPPNESTPMPILGENITGGNADVMPDSSASSAPLSSSVFPVDPSQNEPDAQSVDHADRAYDRLSSPPVEHQGARLNVEANSVASMDRGASITEQIKDALLTQVDEARPNGRTDVALRLDPPELGRMRIHLHASAGEVSARIVVQDDTVRAIVESQFNDLRQRLNDAGVALTRFDVAHDGSRQQASEFEQRQPLWHPAETAAARLWDTRSGTPDEGVRPRGLIDLLA